MTTEPNPEDLSYHDLVALAKKTITQRDHWQARAIALHHALDHVRRTTGMCQADKDVLNAESDCDDELPIEIEDIDLSDDSDFGEDNIAESRRVPTQYPDDFSATDPVSTSGGNR